MTGFPTGVLATSSMNSAFVAVFAMIWLFIGYKWWSRRLDIRLIRPREDAPTPAHRLQDGRDYYPARSLVLFGHHFSSIAGAGPIVGPIVAVTYFGWGPTLLWILAGSIFIGAVHDYTALMVSVQNDGRSVPELARNAVNNKARVLFMIFVWIALVFVITAFCGATRATFVQQPEIVLPTFALIPLAALFGLCVYRWKLNLALCTVGAFAVLLGLLYVGTRVPISLETLGEDYRGPAGKPWFALSARLSADWAGSLWFLLLLGYGFVASVLPVWLLLQPRDYIAAWLLFLGILLGALGVFGSNRAMDAPVVTTALSAKGGPIWPMLFILVACGAISGFHAIVSGGTSSKQLDRERDGRIVGFGSMVVEGLLAVIAVIAVSAGLKYGSGAADEGTLQGLMGKGSAGAIVAFGEGFGVLTAPLLDPLGGVLGIRGIGALFGIVLVNAFVMTTLDTTVRLTRFIGSELMGEKVKLMKNRFAAAFAGVLVAYVLSITGTFGKIWPIFGASNQLLAALTLIIVTAYYVKLGRPRLYTLIPAVFMILTTMAALAYQAYAYLVAPLRSEAKPNYALGVAAVVLFALGLLVAGLAWRAVFGDRGAAAGEAAGLASEPAQ